MPSWVIVGASRGIGYQYLKTLSQEPSNKIFGIVRTPSSTQTKVDTDGLHNVHILEGDLTDPASLSAAAEQVAKFTNNIVDYLVINGAYISRETSRKRPNDYVGKEDVFISELTQSMITNVAGVLFAVNAFIPYVKRSTIKKVIAISSAAGEREIISTAGIADSIPYAISKAGLNTLIAKMAAAYKGDGVAFLALNPGFVLTFVEDPENIPPAAEKIVEGYMVKLRKLQPDSGPISPQESVRMQLNVIEDLTIEQSGEFLGHRGDKRWL